MAILLNTIKFKLSDPAAQSMYLDALKFVSIFDHTDNEILVQAKKRLTASMSEEQLTKMCTLAEAYEDSQYTLSSHLYGLRVQDGKLIANPGPITIADAFLYYSDILGMEPKGTSLTFNISSSSPIHEGMLMMSQPLCGHKVDWKISKPKYDNFCFTDKTKKLLVTQETAPSCVNAYTKINNKPAEITADFLSAHTDEEIEVYYKEGCDYKDGSCHICHGDRYLLELTLTKL